MNVCLDVFALSHFPNTGLYTYAHELVSNLLNIYPHPHYKLITSREGSLIPFSENKRVSIDYLDINRRRNDFRAIANYIRDNNIKLYHSLNNGFSVPKEKDCKYVVTIQDILPLVNKELVDKKYHQKYMELVPQAIESADKVIAVSNYVRAEILKNLAVSEEKIEVIYPNTSKIFKPIWAVHYKKFLSRYYKIAGEFILHVGSIHKRKKLNLLLTLFKELLKSNNNLKLVIIGDVEGKRKEYSHQLWGVINDFELKDNVIFLGMVKHEELPYFYNAANCLINLSKDDGYPLTAMEAMKCQVPVVCYKDGSFAEVLGTYPYYLSSDEPKEIAATLSNVMKVRKESPNLFGIKSPYDYYEPIKKLIRVYESLLYS